MLKSTKKLLAAVTLATLTVTSASAKDIVDTAVGAEGFSTLVAAVKAAGLVDTLKSEGPFTVFAPTDDAFGRLPEGALDALLKDRERLAATLQLHVVPGRPPLHVRQLR